jgi:transcriptional regulator with XRE-family HTH domain
MKDRIIEIRKALKMKQGEFAKRLGIKQSVVSNIERGQNGITDANIRLICVVFNVNEEWLRTGKGEMFIPENSLSEQEKQLLNTFRGLNLLNQNLVSTHAHFLLTSQTEVENAHIHEKSRAKEQNPVSDQKRA